MSGHPRALPCQDTPATRVRYAAKLNVPRQLSVIMSARHVDRRDPIPSEGSALISDDALWCTDDRIVEEFVMEQPIPPYLFAFAVDELGYREVGPRTRVYSEVVLESAATEFASTEDMIRQGEAFFGSYEWERFNLLVLPPSFPYGGMENPRMTFVTSTVLKGDSSGAHELAHSWTGNLITNKTNEHFLLNEELLNWCWVSCRFTTEVVRVSRWCDEKLERTDIAFHVDSHRRHQMLMHKTGWVLD